MEEAKDDGKAPSSPMEERKLMELCNPSHHHHRHPLHGASCHNTRRYQAAAAYPALLPLPFALPLPLPLPPPLLLHIPPMASLPQGINIPMPKAHIHKALWREKPVCDGKLEAKVAVLPLAPGVLEFLVLSLVCCILALLSSWFCALWNDKK